MVPVWLSFTAFPFTVGENTPIKLTLASCRLSCAYPADANNISAPNNIVFFILRLIPSKSSRPAPAHVWLPRRHRYRPFIVTAQPACYGFLTQKRQRIGHSSGLLILYRFRANYCGGAVGAPPC